MTSLNVVVLAAGKGTRMYSDLPKVLHTLAGKPLLQHALDTATALESSKTCVVIGHQSSLLEKALAGQNVVTVMQEPQLGTAHALHQALDQLEHSALALVLYGDVPLVRAETLRGLIAQVGQDSMAVLTCTVGNPHGLGRILRDANGNISGIVEEKDATSQQRNICEINTGIMVIPVARLHQWLPRISTDNAQKEYYLTDIVLLALQDKCAVHTTIIDDEMEATGVNNRQQLAQLERCYQQREAERLMLAGLTLRDPARFDVRGELTAGRDVEIDVNVIIVGKVVLGNRVRIGPNCILRDCEIGEASVIHANTVIAESQIGARCDIGPFARIRPGTVLDEDAKIGNFVEIKKSLVGKNSKVNHLSYVGDSNLGKNVNIGAGTITCNYDGVNKSKTVIGNDVFIGSNSALVAPLTIADGATIGAGSVITQDVASQQLALARGRQVNKDGWQRPEKTP
jgi:bifunctional UDP-N-acetylglucosamine pyrophosphorylase / glucosamine-1-phosphate N-acetyltransferase